MVDPGLSYIPTKAKEGGHGGDPDLVSNRELQELLQSKNPILPKLRSMDQAQQTQHPPGEGWQQLVEELQTEQQQQQQQQQLQPDTEQQQQLNQEQPQLCYLVEFGLLSHASKMGYSALTDIEPNQYHRLLSCYL